MTRANAESMLSAINRDARDTGNLTGRSILSSHVLTAMRSVPREAFVPDGHALDAYENMPLPIGCGQTISQPYIVALMTELLDGEAGARILEVGTGCGYQTAILAEVGFTVFSIEVIQQLAKTAASRLNSLGYDKVRVRAGDGYLGWSEYEPFDGIIVTAAATRIPPPLIQQLKPGGKLIIPVGPAGSTQSLIRLHKQPDGTIERVNLLPVAFVPLTRDFCDGSEQ